MFQLCCTAGKRSRGIGECELLSMIMQFKRLTENIVAQQHILNCLINNVMVVQDITMFLPLYVIPAMQILGWSRLPHMTHSTISCSPIIFPLFEILKMYQNRINEYCCVQETIRQYLCKQI